MRRGLSALRITIAFFLLAAALVGYFGAGQLIRSITQFALTGRASNPDMAMLLAELQTILKAYVHPALLIIAVLAFLNLFGCFFPRPCRLVTAAPG